ncbi:MAG: glycosyltransferase [Clostridia bacterium]|nr:glycosyltransferase [Clostridia bacterium]
MKKKVIMVMPVMKGGGAERVASLLLNEFHKNGYDCEFVITSMKKEDIISCDLNPQITVTVLKDILKKNNTFQKIKNKTLRLFSSAVCKVFEGLKKAVPAELAYLSFISEYSGEIKALRKIFKNNPDAAVISFLQPSIPMTLLASRGLRNRVVISERGNPERLMKKRYGYKFIEKYYKRADAIVFQTQDAKKIYPPEIAVKGTVIFNPIKEDLPLPYTGERDKYITTFCRISRPKNLPMLVKAFHFFAKEHEDFRLKIIGDAQNEDDKRVLDDVKKCIRNLDIEDKIDFIPFNSNVHQMILKDAVYASSSDHEGMSNAMLEAMAIGMPVVCTDCPIGGARAVIKNGENGFLTEVGNSEEMCEAFKKIVTNKTLSDKLSENAAKIREELSLENTAKKWMELL